MGASVNTIRAGNFGPILVGTYLINIDWRLCVPFANWICNGSGTAHATLGVDLNPDNSMSANVVQADPGVYLTP